jgi:tellurite resistance protein
MGQHQPAPLRKMTAPAAVAISRWLLAPHQLRAARQRQQLIDSLTAVLPTSEESSQVGLAILQGARALSLADGDFDQEEWELFYFCLKSLRLSDAQRHSADLHGAPDPNRISASLAAITDPSQRLAIARCYCLFAAADGLGKAAELGLLQKLLQVLGHPELERELPELCCRFRPSPTWWGRFRHTLGERLARWASPHRRRRR